MSRKANCWDNAPQESFFGHMKDEIDLSECTSFQDVVAVIDDYIDYYNTERYQWDLVKLAPVASALGSLLSVALSSVRQVYYITGHEICVGAKSKWSLTKGRLHLIIVYIMISKEVAGTKNWSAAERAIKKGIRIDDALFIALLKQVFDQLHRSPFWSITPEFIMTLGETYLSLFAHLMMGR